MAVGTRETWIADPRSDDELIAAAVVETQLVGEEYERASGAFYVLLWRSGPELLQRAIELTESTDWKERELGVDLLGQIPAASGSLGSGAGWLASADWRALSGLPFGGARPSCHRP
ncbi:MAG: hypothetical protein JHD16_04880 [Solirubrobacteraceae bacterium]|nr:hypothetical protein [Solirubrobacteraceae bacterium]